MQTWPIASPSSETSTQIHDSSRSVAATSSLSFSGMRRVPSVAKCDADRIEGSRVLDAGEVSWVLTRRDGADRAADDLRAAGPRQLVDEHDPRRAERAAEVLRHNSGEVFAAARRRPVCARRTPRSSRPSPRAAHPTAADSATAGCAASALSTSAGPIRLPAIDSVSSLRPCRNQKPSSSTLAQSPCTHTPGQRRQYVSR